MNVEEAYDVWSDQYDTNENKTRDLEAESLIDNLGRLHFGNCLEIGCGTGKNTNQLLSKAKAILAIDLSEKMLEKARAKISSERVRFAQADITMEWDFTASEEFDLVTFSLVLEHIQELKGIFEKLKKIVSSKGYVYIGELHPFKQYLGTKARFETDRGIQIVPCYNHHISEFIFEAKRSGFNILVLNEYFDNKDKSGVPRILTLFLQKEA